MPRPPEPELELGEAKVNGRKILRFFLHMKSMVGSLVYWFVGSWLAGSMVGSLAGWLVDSSILCLGIGWMDGCIVGWINR